MNLKTWAQTKPFDMIKYGLIMLLFIGLSACGIYRQNVVNVPLLQQKDQIQIGGHISFNGLEGQGAYALTNKIAFLASYSDMGARTRDNYVDKHTFKEIGTGLYKKTTTGKIREVFLFVGRGMTSHTALKRDSVLLVRSQKVNYNRFLIQTDFGNKHKRLEHAFSIRLLAVHYYNIVDNTRTDYQDLSKFHIYGEGAVTLRYDLLKYFKISGQGCFTLPISHAGGGYNYYYDFSPFNFSLGVIFNMAY